MVAATESAPALAPCAAEPAVPAQPPETMLAYISRVKAALNTAAFEVVDGLKEDGLYVGKRPIRGAQGQGGLLNQAGTVLQHVLLYLKEGGKVTALEFGPAGGADVTANVMEPAPCGPIVLPDTVPEPGMRLLRVLLPVAPLADPLVQKAINFMQNREYHAVHQNCIHTADFLARILTRGRLRSAPLVYDALAGTVPQQDHPMLLMFFLMTQLSWFHVCDGSPQTAAFLQQEGLASEQAAVPATGDAPPPEVRLREKQADLLRLIQGLQQNGSAGAAGNGQFAS